MVCSLAGNVSQKFTQLEEKSPSQRQTFGYGKSLLTLYPEGDPRLVYQKYQSNAIFDSDNRLYAGLFVSLSKLAKGQNAVMYQKTQNNTGSKLTNDPTSLLFDSAFESGNLFAAFRIKENEYDLILQNDINTKGNTQWFFFSVSQCKKNCTVKFNIVNLVISILLQLH